MLEHELSWSDIGCLHVSISMGSFQGRLSIVSPNPVTVCELLISLCICARTTFLLLPSRMLHFVCSSACVSSINATKLHKLVCIELLIGHCSSAIHIRVNHIACQGLTWTHRHKHTKVAHHHHQTGLVSCGALVLALRARPVVKPFSITIRVIRAHQSMCMGTQIA